MKTTPEHQLQVDIFVKYIRQAIQEIDPKIQISLKKIVGLVILQFPADHDEHTEIQATFVGAVCPSCAMKCIYTISSESIAESNPLAR